MSKRILLIGQAPSAIKQEVPYDTTMLYIWLEECGISKEQAQEMFEFEAMVDKFPGHGNGGHKKPNDTEMAEHYNNVLSAKIEKVDKVILLGKVSQTFMWANGVDIRYPHVQWLELIHPSKRNTDLYNKNKEQIINSLKEFINK